MQHQEGDDHDRQNTSPLSKPGAINKSAVTTELSNIISQIMSALPDEAAEVRALLHDAIDTMVTDVKDKTRPPARFER